ncbi:MAG: Right handed beta helix region [Fibrobacteres bacterium]|nr:Right handed beta helix region [Fibrobacterota bacterium]
MFASLIPHFLSVHRRRGRIGSIPLCLVGAAMVSSCIDRSNPFDPVNVGPKRAESIREEQGPDLAALLAPAAAFTRDLAGFTGLFRADSAHDAAIIEANAGVRVRNETTAAVNVQIAAYNDGKPPVDSLRKKSLYPLPDTLKAFGPYDGFQAKRTGLQSVSAQVSGFMSTVNGRYLSFAVYPPAMRDSILAPLVRDSLGFVRLQIRMDSANLAVRDSNAAVRVYAQARAAENAMVKAYNDSIGFLISTQARPPIVRSDSLQAKTFLAKPGDSLVLGPGTFQVELQFTNSGTPDSPIVVRGYPGRSTIIRPTVKNGVTTNNAMILSKQNYIRFEDLVFRGGTQGTAKVQGQSTNISFRRCLFDSSAGPGLEAFDSDLELTDCEIRANGGVGVKLGGGTYPGWRMRFTNVLIVRNKGVGLECTSQYLEMKNCTLADNGSHGIQIISPLQTISIANSILSGNLGFGIDRQATNINQDLFVVSESDLFGNASGNWNLPAMDSAKAEKLIKANLVVNPDFNDAAAFDYGPKPGSILDAYERQSPTLTIGFRKPAP